MDTRVFASQKGFVFSIGLKSKEGISFHAVSRLQQDVKSVKVGDERSTFEVPTVFFSENLIP